MLIQLNVPENYVPPSQLMLMTAEEVAVILNAGTELLLELKKHVLSCEYDNMMSEAESRFKQDVDKLKMELKMKSEVNEELSRQYNNQLDVLLQRCDGYKRQLVMYETEQSVRLQNEAFKLYEVKLQDMLRLYEVRLHEKETRLNEKETCLLAKDKIIEQLISKTTTAKGKEGELTFEQIAQDTFRDFKGFNLLDKHTQGGAGDFHIHFEDFDVLVDAKNYTKKVPNEQRDKIKNDLNKNIHITFAWLVSLNTHIDKFDKAPVMYEWINSKQCIVYINNLLDMNPNRLLRTVFYTCKELHKFTADDHEELTMLQTKYYKSIDTFKNMKKRMREINTSHNTTKTLLQGMEDDIREFLTSETNEIANDHYNIFDSWWEDNIIISTGKSLLSTDLWFKFRSENKQLVDQMELTVDKFKQFIKTKIPSAQIINKSKNKQGALQLQDIDWKISDNNTCITSNNNASQPNTLFGYITLNQSI